MKTAIVHPWFLEAGGAEKVADVLAQMYPDADVFALSVDPACVPDHLRDRPIRTSALNRLISVFRFRRASFMLLFPWAIESLDLSQYDLVISSCPPLMGINVSQDAVHICYCHSPQRAWWSFYAQRQAQMGWLAKKIFVACAVFLRIWEFNAMQRIDHVISNSQYISSRVFTYFRRKSTVIYPPVNTSMGYVSDRHDGYYLSVSRLDRDKGTEFLIEACNRLKRRLLIAGVGREEKRLRAIAGPTVEFLGRVPDGELPELYAKCRAFLFAADEDFGIVAVEAQSFGRPVIAYGHGGSLETVRVNDPEGRPDTGVFFPEQTTDSVMDGILRFEAREDSFLPAEIQRHAMRFDRSVFEEKMRRFIEDAAQRSQEKC
jgi:glycosyltransferase involved in cell wall biosynthesis